jgi:HPt (histidine-containing phosphotransfer) domain-containing protein
MDTQDSGKVADEELDQCALDELRSLDPDGSSGIVTEIIQAYLAESPALIAQLRAAIAAANIDGMTHAAHSMKSSSLTLGAKRVGDLAAEMESNGRANRMDGCHALLADLEKYYAKAEQLLKACISTL